MKGKALATCEIGGTVPPKHCKEDVAVDAVPAKPLIEDYVALGTSRFSFLPMSDHQRHISREATKEIKWDGYRAIAEIEKSSVRLYSRKLKSLEGYFPQLVETLSRLDIEAVIDGEVVVLDAEGRSHFELLRHRQRREKDHLVYYVFDLLYLNGRDLRSFPLLHRKTILRDLIEGTCPSGVQVSDHIEGQGKALFDVACQRGLEGIVGKDAASPYVSGARTDYWVKLGLSRFTLAASQEALVTLSRCYWAFSKTRISFTLATPTKA